MKWKSEDQAPKLLVLYDHGGFLRTAVNTLEPDERAPFDKLIADASAVVACLNSDLSQLNWLNRLLVKAEAEPKMRAKTTIQVTADGLRKANAKITKYGALEDTVRDILEHLNRTDSPLCKLAGLADHLVIVFSETGGLYLKKGDAGFHATLHFCPNFDRIAQSDARKFGTMPGKVSIFLVAVIKELIRAGLQGKAFDLRGAVGLGTIAYNRYFKVGFKQPDGETAATNAGGAEPTWPFSTLPDALSVETCDKLHEGARDLNKRDLLLSTLAFAHGDSGAWTRTAGLLRDPRFDQRLLGIVKRGLDAELTEQPDTNPKSDFPASLILVPYAAIGKLRLLDEEEIRRHYTFVFALLR